MSWRSLTTFVMVRSFSVFKAAAPDSNAKMQKKVNLAQKMIVKLSQHQKLVMLELEKMVFNVLGMEANVLKPVTF